MDEAISTASNRRWASSSAMIASTEAGTRNLAEPLSVIVFKRPANDSGTWLRTSHRIVVLRVSSVVSSARD